MNLYLVKRGPRPDYHKVPCHPVIICTKRDTAEWEAGNSSRRAWVWEMFDGARDIGGWLLVRWEGLDIDYRPVVSGFTLPDGTETAFWHKHDRPLPWDLLKGAVWWSDRRMPDWLKEAGAVYPPDQFTRDRILEDLGEIRRRDPDHRVTAPDFWPPVNGEAAS